MSARFAFPFLVLAAAGASASAQDAAKPAPKPDATTAAPAPAAKKERKTTPEAEAALKKYACLLHFPNAASKSLAMNSHCDVPALNGEVGCKFSVSAAGEVTADISLPEAAKEQYGEALASIKTMIGGIFRPFLVPADVMAKQYDLSSKVENGLTIVEMTRFDDTAAWDKATLRFNAAGLLEKQVGTRNVDPNDPMSAMDAGVEIETTFEYKKRGELYTIESAKMTQPAYETSAKLTYWDLPSVAPLPKQIDFSSQLVGDFAILVHDFVVDGKKVEGTQRKDEKKADPPAVKKPELEKPAGPEKAK